MIKRSTISKAEDRIPFLLKPVGKDYLWGGDRLNTQFGKAIEMSPLAETWECSVHPDGESIIASGVHAGKSLAELLNEKPELLGTNVKGELPILIKLIDAKQNLSVQVHPDDDYAKTHENGQLGKSEMWYVLDAEENAAIVYGFQTDTSKEALRASIANGSVEKYLNRVPIQKDDMFFVNAGTVHAIGAGALIAEIQQSSNLTYRLYDYNRTDANGQKRPLHIDKALDVADLQAVSAPRQPMRTLRYKRGYASELLCRCPYFTVERILLNAEGLTDSVNMHTHETSFEVLLCIDGRGTMAALTEEDGASVLNQEAEKKSARGNEVLHFSKGDCIFLPANTPELELYGHAQLLKVRC